MENIEIEVPMQVLDAATFCAAKNDVRFYLNGVAINKGHVVSTDGHRAFACKIDLLNHLGDGKQTANPNTPSCVLLNHLGDGKHGG